MMRSAAPERDADVGDAVSPVSPANLAQGDRHRAGFSVDRAHLDRIDREIEGLRKAGAAGPAAKWDWFKERFQWATNQIP